MAGRTLPQQIQHVRNHLNTQTFWVCIMWGVQSLVPEKNLLADGNNRTTKLGQLQEKINARLF